MTTIHLTRRALNAGLATSLLLGMGAVRAASSQTSSSPASARLAELADAYYRGKLELFPVDATENTGDPAYEAAFTIDIAPEHLRRERAFLERTLASLRAIDAGSLGADERVTYDLIAYDAADRLAVNAVSLQCLMPVGHMDSLPVRFGQWAGGNGSQPMKTAQNYEHFLARLKRLPEWIDQAIANMRTGIKGGVTLPRAIVERTLPQLAGLVPADIDASPYLAGVNNFPDGVAAAQRPALRAAYRQVVQQSVATAVQRLHAFMKDQYLPASRTTAGIGSLPGGAQWYRAAVRSSTTTDMTAAQAHELGLREVARIRGEMEDVKRRLGFNGSLDAFLQSIDSRPEFTPYRSEEEIVRMFQALSDKVASRLPRLFERAPKAKLEVRAVDPARRDTASSYYVPPAIDGSRPGVFFVAVADPLKFQSTGATALFLHEGQPGHHYQMAMQREIPSNKLRQTTWYDAYGEGWALYAEGLGRDLGVYDEPAAMLGRLQLELHRAIRLVVDSGLHDKGWSREQTIAYVRSTEGSDEDTARRAVERYMAWPGQALAYKVGELKIIELRERARRALGDRFDIRRFHTQVLADGCVPLAMLERKIDGWIASQTAQASQKTTG